jgi:hypothetical protein
MAWPTQPAARFLTPLVTVDVDGGHWRVVSPFKFYSADLKRIVRVDPASSVISPR